MLIHRSIPLASLLVAVSCHELCTSFDAPVNRAGDFSSCTIYNGETRVCVQPANEATITADVDALGIAPDASCRTKFILPMYCSLADAWAAHLYDGETSDLKLVPFLCDEYARLLYTECKDTQMTKNPFLSPTNVASNDDAVDGTIASKFASADKFVEAFSHHEYCFDGSAFDASRLNPTEVSSGAPGVCIEKVANLEFPNGIYINLVPVPGHDDLVFFGDHSGVVELRRVGAHGVAAEKVHVVADLQDKILFSGNPSDERGLLGIAFHKEFADNGKVFFSYSCEGEGCLEDGATTLVEFVVTDATSEAGLKIADTSSGRLVFETKQPYGNHNGGLVLFSPDTTDPHLYLFLGDGGSGGDPENNAQNMQSPLGKVLRLDVDGTPDAGKGYAIPSDNPFVGNDSYLPEIWASGLRNPWRCSFDSNSSENAVLVCGDVGQGNVEEVDVIVKAGNYGWKRFEGGDLFAPNIVIPEDDEIIPPIITYRHDGKVGGSVTGGYVYRGSADTRLTGRYVFADLYNKLFITDAPIEDEFEAVPFTQFQFLCSKDSPLDCETKQNSIYTFGEDNRGDVYFISMSGVHRIVAPTSCENVTDIPNPPEDGGNIDDDSGDASTLKSGLAFMSVAVAFRLFQ